MYSLVRPPFPEPPLLPAEPASLTGLEWGRVLPLQEPRRGGWSRVGENRITAVYSRRHVRDVQEQAQARAPSVGNRKGPPREGIRCYQLVT